MHYRLLLRILCKASLALGQSSTSSTGALPSDIALNLCFGDESICALSNDLFATCSGQLGGSKNQSACYCTSGYFAATQDCDDCQQYYSAGTPNSGGLMSNYTVQCESLGLTVAPLPSSVASVWSIHNASWSVYLANGTFPATSATKANSTPIDTTLVGIPTGTLPSVSVTRGAIPSETASSSGLGISHSELILPLLAMLWTLWALDIPA